MHQGSFRQSEVFRHSLSPPILLVQPGVHKEHLVFLRMPILTGVARQALPNAPLTTDGHKHTYTRHPLPDLYLQNTCEFAVKSALSRGAIDKRLRGLRICALRTACQAASRTGERLGERENLRILYFTLENAACNPGKNLDVHC